MAIHNIITNPQAAEAMLAAAVNQQKDVIFDGTMSWAPFVEQTVAMVRDHRRIYRRGPGLVKDAKGRGCHVLRLYSLVIGFLHFDLSLVLVCVAVPL